MRVIQADWDEFCIVAAPGPSLSGDVAEACRGYRIVVVNDAFRRLPFADILYACDETWWQAHDGCPEFAGERWSSHGSPGHNDKREIASRYGVSLIRGRDGDGFCRSNDAVNYGHNSGFQAVNLACHKIGWSGRVVLVGFDMRRVDGKGHFFGEHPDGLRTTDKGFAVWPKEFEKAEKMLPAGLEIVNCTPGSALTCFRMMELRDALPDPA